MFPFAAPESVLSNFETSHLSKGESSMSLETWFAESETEKKKKRAKGGPGDLLSCDSYFLPNDRHVHIFTHRSRAVACVHCSPRVRLVSADRTVTGWKCSYPRCHLDQNFIQVWLVDISCGQLNWTSRQDWRFNSVMESSTVETIFYFFFLAEQNIQYE